LLSGPRKGKTVERCNIATAAKLLNRIAAVGEQKLPESVKGPSHVLSEKNLTNYGITTPVTYRSIVRPLGQWFTGLVIEAINPRPVVRKIVNAP